MARALTARVAALACELGSPIVELTVRSDNPAQEFYRRNGFAPLPQCLTYVRGLQGLSAQARGFVRQSRRPAYRRGLQYVGQRRSCMVTELPQRLTTKQNEIAVINYAYALLESQGIAPANVEIGEAALPALSR